MVNATQRLRVLRSEIESAERNASAERAFAATGAKDNPWKGATDKLNDLNKEQRELQLQQSGEALVGKLERLRALDADLTKAQQARELADRYCLQNFSERRGSDSLAEGEQFCARQVGGWSRFCRCV